MSSPLYHNSRWKATRERILKRDLYTCQQCGCGLTTGRRHPRAAVVHHLIPHHGDAELFWCPDDGLDASCKQCHDGPKQSEEARGYSDRIGEDGWPVDSRHPFHTGKLPRRWGYSIPQGIEPSGVPVMLVCGPPASGKSTYVRDNLEPGDTVIDFNVIRKKLGGVKWDQCPDIRRQAFARRARMLKGLRDRRRGRCWFIVTAPTQAERDTWVDALGDATLVVMDTPKQVCIDRILADPERRPQADSMIAAVNRWRA